MPKYLMFLSLASLFLLTVSPVNAKADIVVLQVNESSPIWSKTLPEGGLGSELVQAISTEAGLNTRIDFLPLKRLIADTSNNDLGNPLFYMQNQEFEQIIPIAVSYNAFFAYKNDINTLLVNSANKRIGVGVIKGTQSNISSEYAYFEESNSHKSLFKKLKAKRLDLVLELDLVGKSMTKDDKDISSSILEESGSPIAILIDIDYPNAKEIALRYQKGLETIMKNGVYQKILNKYYGKNDLPNSWYRDLKKFKTIYTIY